MSIKGLHFRYKNIKRLHQIGNVLIKHGMGYLVGRLNLLPFFAFARKIAAWAQIGKERSPRSVAVSVRHILEDLGPTFIKFGQLISTRPDLLPDTFSAEFKKLQDNVPPFSFAEVTNIVESEFQAPLDKLYASFDPKPHAAASIAQVHMARLHDGKEVVVKVQRPGIKETIAKDLELLFYFAELLERQVPEARIYQPMGIAEELSRSIRRELDFLLESNNAKRLWENFADDPTVLVPQVYWDLTSSTVMTMERLEGIPVDEVLALQEAGLDLRTIAFNGCEAFLKQIFEHGFFHADPHPGNILVGEENRIIFLDFGQMGHLDDSHMTHIANVLFAITDRDYERLVHEYLMLGFTTGETNVEAFKRDIIDFFEPYYGQTLKNIPVGLVFTQAMKLMGKHRIQSPVDLMLLAKTFVFVESIGRQLDPDFNLLETARPYATTLLKKRLHPKRMAGIFSKNLYEVGELFKIMPRQVQMLMRKLVQGELEINNVHHGLDALLQQQRRSGKELAVTLLAAGLIVGSALLLQNGGGPFFLGIHLGLIGLGAAFVLCLVVFVSMLF